MAIANYEFSNLIESDESTLGLVNRLYAQRNKLNHLLFQEFPKLEGVCRVVVVADSNLIIHTNGPKAHHMVTLQQKKIQEFLQQHVDFVELRIKNRAI